MMNCFYYHWHVMHIMLEQENIFYLFQEHLEEADEADLEHFTTKVWPNIKDVYKPPGTESKGENQDDTEQDKVRAVLVFEEFVYRMLCILPLREFLKIVICLFGLTF